MAPANDERGNLPDDGACKDQERAKEEAKDGARPKAHEGRRHWQYCITRTCATSVLHGLEFALTGASSPWASSNSTAHEVVCGATITSEEGVEAHE